MGQDTQELLAQRFPHSWHLFPELEAVCGTVKREIEENGSGSEARICFNATGLDTNGRLIVKCFETVLKIFRRK